jgi:hypothetical protein
MGMARICITGPHFPKKSPVIDRRTGVTLAQINANSKKNSRQNMHKYFQKNRENIGGF